MSCTRLWFDISRPTTSEQSADLAAKLRRQGHNLDIRHRPTPAMNTTRAWREEEKRKAERQKALLAAEEAKEVKAKDNAEPQPDPEAPTVRLLGESNCRELRRETGPLMSPVLVEYQAGPAEPLHAVAVFTFLLPDWDWGTLAYTVDGLAIVSDAWIAASIPARTKTPRR